MTNKPLLVMIAAFLTAFVLAVGTAFVLVTLIEARTYSRLSAALGDAGLGWTEVSSDGLTVALSGTAPDESARIRALQVAGEVVGATRISETIHVPIQNADVAPVFRIELMRHGNDLSVIGLVPAGADGANIAERLSEELPEAEVADMLQSTRHIVPRGWGAGVDFAVEAVSLFETGRISVAEGRVELEALVNGATERTQLETALREIAPEGHILSLVLNMPRPVATPFLMRVELSNGEWRLGACSADTDEARELIARSLRTQGYTGRVSCPLALGAPSPRWGEAAAGGISALATLGDGRFELSDAEATLIASHTVSGADFDRAVGRLEQRLPDAFVLRSEQLPPPPEANAETDSAEVDMTLSETGDLVIAGRLPNERIRNSVRTFARARFGLDAVELTARLDDSLPVGWSVRVLTALEALAELHHGRVRVDADTLAIYGVSGNPDVVNQVTQVLVQGLGDQANYTLAISYDEAFDPVAQAPTPDNCERRVQEVLSATKITFDAGSSRIDAASGRVVDEIAEILRECGELPFEVAGYTDSQGSEETNQRISQARAEAVINALLQRRVLVGALVARGYGPANPIADNATEAGREANRRIEFRLIRPEPDPLERDPETEAALVFEVQTPGPDTIRPRPRPGGDPAQDDAAPDEGAAEAGEQQAGPNAGETPEAEQDEAVDVPTEELPASASPEDAPNAASEQPESTPSAEATVADRQDAPAASTPEAAGTEPEAAPASDPSADEAADAQTSDSPVSQDEPAAEELAPEEPAAENADTRPDEATLSIEAEQAGNDDLRPQPRPETAGQADDN